ncbi:UBA/TS-N domain containing protein [Trichomonas vaginalis G3]|uniref:UBA/TS-N domain containing protein n=1 Tax=Trichomonas vaginalis (strain ATCC PRA-98 / G3) TaxID=412133 RepID=A2E2D4_TRIV3|nr:UV excision repair protein RAD23 family [Trichomonas vaginalis G3]EAY13109.1 UBA/TS-N domain containing protein [Trichomonas vaginalis G3]KAI5528210.1 UV excision repair protein RAD23 family [Trichomonas vaginalis G3]|eukprot:XP_001325332.1 UBA/TS-N domain containing protein [Trichomonas vaginalis G3]
MKYRIRTISNDEAVIELDEQCTVNDLLQKACELLNREASESVLIFSSNKLTNLDQPLNQIGYKEQKTIILHTISQESKKIKLLASVDPQNLESSDPNKSNQIDITKQERFSKALENITAMGFSPDNAEQALRIAAGNQNEALNIILNRRVSQPRLLLERHIEESRMRSARRRNAKKIRLSPGTPHSSRDHVNFIPGFKIAEKRKFKPDVENLYIGFIKNNERTMEALTNVIQEQSLDLLDSIQQNPSPMLTMLGLTVQRNEINGIQTTPYLEVFSEPLIKAMDLTPDEVPVIQRLLSVGAPLSVTIKVYRSTNNDEVVARRYLRANFMHRM